MVEGDRFTAELERCRRVSSTRRVRCTVKYTSHIDDEAYRGWSFSTENIVGVDANGVARIPQEIETHDKVDFDGSDLARSEGDVWLVLGYRDSGTVEVTFNVPTEVREFSTLTLGGVEFRQIRF